jgi:hypothetical protein
MEQPSVPVRAAQRAWSIYLASNRTVNPHDGRRCTLERYLHQRWRSGDSDLEELTCSGLLYLSRVSALETMPD